jgi:formylmethanofuran dehydrogenase subunit E
VTVELRTIDPAEIRLEELVERGVQFHGHLGPFLVSGLRMGLLALRELDSRGHFDLRAVVETGTTPPLSCMIDGIQVATGCTLGKGNIEVLHRNKARATFSKGERRLVVELRPEVLELIEEGDVEALAWQVMEMEDEKLFRWELR